MNPALPTAERAMVTLEGLEKRFPGTQRPALSDLAGVIPQGVVTGVVGPDGAGKTTLLRLIAGLLKPTAGVVRFADAGPLAALTTQSGGIGYMPQKFGLYEDLSVRENLELHADLRAVLEPERGKVFARLLEFTDLARFCDRLAGKLSGGMKQKLGLACALLGHPRLLLLDEPGVGVDPISRRELWRMVHDLIGEGITVVWSTAYLDEAEQCRHVLVLNEGRLLFGGDPSELTDRVRNRCFQIQGLAGGTRQFLPRLLQQPEVLDGVLQGQNIRVVLRPGAAPPELAPFGAGGRARLVPVKPRFEDAFMDALGGGPGGESPLASRFAAVTGNHDPVVEAVELTKKFGDFAATDRVSFAVNRGEIFGLLGPNGAGKSTTFRMLCGLLSPTSGTAHVLGIDLKKSPSRARQRLGYMAQKFSLYGNLTARQNLNFFSGAYGLRGQAQAEAVSEMVDAFNLDSFLDTAADQLALGFKQRLALACALMHRPDVVFLDEPTSGVDPVTRREFWSHINGIVTKGVTVVVTTHFMEEAEYCDRIALISRGRITATGSPDELKQQAVTSQRPEPSMEDAFIALVEAHPRREPA
jgi:ABC-2 type transport system ATP-binding protein